MDKRIRLLAALLGVQVMVALVLGASGTGVTAKATSAPLLALQGKTIERVIIEGPEQAKVTVAKTDGGWRLPGQDNFPADRDRVERLLTRLKELKHGAPVATTKGALERFKVSEKNFERRITLASGADTLAVLYLGTSPAMRQVHAREAKQKRVYAVAFATYDVPVKPEDWEEKTVLRIPKDEIAAIEVDGLRLVRVESSGTAETNKDTKEKTNEDIKTEGASWQVAGPIKASLKPEAAEKLAGLLADLHFKAVLGQAEQPSYGLRTPQLALTITRKDGQTVAYRLGKMKDRDEYALKVSTRPEYFRVPNYTAKPLTEAATRTTLLGTGKVPPKTGAKAAKPRPRG